MNKKYEKIMSYFLVFIMVFSYISPIYGMFDVYAEGEEIPNNEYVGPVYPEVSSDKYTLNGLDLENNTLKVNVNEKKVITLETEEDYYISSCGVIYRDYTNTSERIPPLNTSFMTTTREDKSCTIDVFNYGKSPMMIEISNRNYSSKQTVKFYLDAESEEYLNIAVDNMPDEIDNSRFSFDNYVPTGVNHNNYYPEAETICKYDELTNKRYCNIDFNLCHVDIDDTTKFICSSPKTKKIYFTSSHSGDFYLSNYSLMLGVGDSKEITVDSFFGKFTDLIWVSENNDVASVNPNGKITAKGIGETLVKVYDRLTYKFKTVNVTVTDNLANTAEDIANNLNNKSVTIDINHENGVFGYDKIWTEQGPQINPWYEQIVTTYVNKVLNKASIHNFNANTATCNGNTCSLKITRWGSNSNIEEEYTITDLTINLKGLSITSFTTYGSVYPSYTSDGNLNLNQTFDLTYTSYLDSNSEVIIKYDKEYIAKEEETNMYKAIKSGYTEIEIITDGYSDKVDVLIKYDQDKEQQFNNYVKNINTITLPYNSLSLGGNNLKYLEKIVGNKLINDYPDEEVKKLLTAEVKCLSTNVCNYRMFSHKNYNYIIGGNYSYTNRIVKINYEEKDNDTVNEIKRLDNLIKDYYVIDINTVINLENTIDNDELFYDSLINHTDLINVNSNLDIEYVKLNTYKLNRYIKGGVNYLVKISKDNNLLFAKEITVSSDHVVEMAANLDKNGKSNHLKQYVDSVLKSDSTNTFITDNIYEVTTDNKNFYLILDQKDYVKLNQVSVIDKLFELKSGETKQIKYKVYPENGTAYEEIEFEVENDKIATVDEKGNVTGVSKGHTYIDVKLNGSTSRILVTVDMSVKDALNTYLHYIEDNIKVDYANLRYNNLEQAIKNEISNSFYNYNFWLPFNAVLKIENGRYYAAIGYSISHIYGYDMVTSDYKEITYSYEGIKVKDYVYYLNKGDVVDTELSFTEGDNYNLYFSYSKDDVVKYDHKGRLTALKPGIVDVYINDKYNKYWNHISVVVNFEEYVDSVFKSFETNKIRVNANEYSRHTDFQGIVSSKISDRLPMWNIDRAYNISCDEINLECTYRIHKDSSYQSEIDKEVTFDIIREGIFIDEYELNLNKGEDKEIKYTIENDEGNVRVKSLNPNVCKIENNKIIGIDAGLCTVKYETNKNYAYQHILVGKNEIVNMYNTGLRNVNDGLEVPLLGFDNNNHNFEDPEMFAYSFEHLSISGKIKEAIGLDTEYFVNVNFKSDDEDKYNDVEIGIYPQFVFEDSKNNYYYQYNYDQSIFDIRKEIDITPIQINEDDMKIGTKIKEQVKDRYKLSILQYLRLRLANKSFGLHEYSDFAELVKKECQECRIEFGEGGGTGGEGYIEEGGTYIVFKGNNPIAAFNLTFEASIEVLQSGEIFSELEFINLIKETVRDAYLKALKELTGVSRMSTRNVKSYRLNDEVEVDVKKEFDPTIGQTSYVITVDDITFRTKANTEVVGDVNYTYSVTNLELSESNLNLNKGQSKVIGYRVTPDNATNKQVKFESSNNNVVTVDQNGTVIAIGAGNATITVTTKDGSNISKQVTVTVIDNSGNDGEVGEAIPEPKVLLGDVNVDGKINMNDLITLRKYFAGNVTLSSQGLKNVDITKDGKINMNDLIGLRKFLAN